MLIVRNVFGVLSLQVGVATLAVLFMTLAACILLVNILSLAVEAPIPWIIMFLFILMMSIIWLIAFIGTYRESYNLISAAFILWTIYLILSAVIMGWSAVQENKDFCIESRCPDVLWLINKYPSCESKNNKIENKNVFCRDDASSNINKKCSIIPQLKNKICKCNRQKKFTNEIETNNKVIKKCCKTFSTPTNKKSFVTTMILCFLYAQLLLYSWTVLYSYQKEIECQINMQ